jgi:hypothetical protein
MSAFTVFRYSGSDVFQLAKGFLDAHRKMGSPPRDCPPIQVC